MCQVQITASRFCGSFSGVFTEYSVVGLEAGRRCDLLGGIEIGFYSAELPGAWFLDYDGQFICDEIVQDG